MPKRDGLGFLCGAVDYAVCKWPQAYKTFIFGGVWRNTMMER